MPSPKPVTELHRRHCAHPAVPEGIGAYGTRAPETHLPNRCSSSDRAGAEALGDGPGASCQPQFATSLGLGWVNDGVYGFLIASWQGGQPGVCRFWCLIKPTAQDPRDGLYPGSGISHLRRPL